MTYNFTQKIYKYIKNITTLVLLFILLFTISSCKKEDTIKDPIAIGYKDNIAYIINKDNQLLELSQYDQVLPIFNTYLMVRKDNKWGFITNNGNETTKIKYDKISQMNEDKAVVEYEGKTVIIDPKGNELYTFKDGITSYSYFNENMLIIEKDGLLGYLKYDEQSKSFNVIVEPQYFFADTFHEGKAVVGKYENDVIKYNYLNNDGSLLFNEFIFDEADEFSEGIAKVKSSTKYSFITSTPDENNNPVYLKDSYDRRIIFDYATKMQNGISFIADYVYYQQSVSETTRYYKNYKMVSPTGEYKYEIELNNFSKPTPQSFLPIDPIYINDILIFLNGSRRTGVWNIVKHTTYNLYNDITEEFYEDYDFVNVNFTIPEDDAIINSFMKENKYTHSFASTYLESPYEIGTFKFNSTLNQYIAMTRIYGNKCGLISITTTPNVNPKPDSLDEYIVVVKYISSINFDNIVY